MLRAKFAERAEKAKRAQEANEEYVPSIFSIHGRIGRLRFVCYQSVFFVLIIALLAIFILLFFAKNRGEHHLSEADVYLFYCLLVVAFGLCLTPVIIVFSIRRLHDLDQSGWLVALMVIPFINVMLILALLLIPGKNKPNQYGLPPCPNSIGVIIIAIAALIISFCTVLIPF